MMFSPLSLVICHLSLGGETGFLRQFWVFNRGLVKKPGFWQTKDKGQMTKDK